MKGKIITGALSLSLFVGAGLFSAETNEQELRVEIAKEIMSDLPIWQQLEDNMEAVSTQMAFALNGGQEAQLEVIKEDLVKAMKKVYGSEAFRERYASLYAKHFTVAELKAMKRFYASEEGRSITKKLDPLMRDAMAEVPVAMLEVIDRFDKILKEDERLTEDLDLSLFRQQFEAMKQML